MKKKVTPPKADQRREKGRLIANEPPKFEIKILDPDWAKPQII